ncbi:MAG: hypothetical protein U1E01_07705 [Methylicorpusculum sp.]|nr:hypothetical protein [Methylicorpusculum sp.]MDO8844963.1 hypothetical protein [Methylicorpusculum sp.]MDZ4150954.1 hypothetical protein [Methylicorpusculum sp.]
MIAALFFIFIAIVLIMASLIVLLRPVKTAKPTSSNDKSEHQAGDDQR